MLFVISLLQTSGSAKGTRHVVDHLPYVIGRLSDCDLELRSRTVSRRHCVIEVIGERVFLRDLGSRNGTLVDGDRCDGKLPIELFHHRVLQVGKYGFRVSIRDAKTRQPHRPTPLDLSTLSGGDYGADDLNKDAKDLLSELDDLASRLEIIDDPSSDLSEPRQTPTEPRTIRLSEDASNRQHEDADDSGEVDDLESHDTTMLVEPAVGAQTEQHQQADDSQEEEKGKRLPDHLRPKGPKDSQDAAAAALKNLFIR